MTSANQPQPVSVPAHQQQTTPTVPTQEEEPLKTEGAQQGTEPEPAAPPAEEPYTEDKPDAHQEQQQEEQPAIPQEQPGS